VGADDLLCLEVAEVIIGGTGVSLPKHSRFIAKVGQRDFSHNWVESERPSVEIEQKSGNED
jgi:hypothetical protein